MEAAANKAVRLHRGKGPGAGENDWGRGPTRSKWRLPMSLRWSSSVSSR